MTDINLNTIVSKKSGILSSVVDEETVLLCIENSKYYGIDPVGTSIWNLLDKPQSIEEVIISIRTEYNVPADQCEKDVIHFINHLLDKKLVQTQSE